MHKALEDTKDKMPSATIIMSNEAIGRNWEGHIPFVSASSSYAFYIEREDFVNRREPVFEGGRRHLDAPGRAAETRQQQRLTYLKTV